MRPPGIEPATLCCPVFRFNHRAIGTVNDIMFKFLHYCLRYFQSTGVTMHVLNLCWLDVYKNWLSDKIYISFTNIDIIYYSIQNFVWANANQIIISSSITLYFLSLFFHSHIFSAMFSNDNHVHKWTQCKQLTLSYLSFLYESKCTHHWTLNSAFWMFDLQG